MSSSTVPDGLLSATGAPHLPEGFTGTFTSRYIDTGNLRQHTVTGGARRRFAVAGHGTGMWIGDALAADHPDRVACLAVAETPLPGVFPSLPLLGNAHLNERLWHFAFNRLAEVNDQLVAGREDVYFGWQFASKAAKELPGYAVRHYVDTLAADPGALHASFAIYRARDTTIAQNQQRNPAAGRARAGDRA